MQLKELRRLYKLTESLPDETSVNIDFCGYTSDDEYLSEILIRNDGDIDFVELNFSGYAYETEDFSPKPRAFWFPENELIYRAAYKEGNEASAIRCALDISDEKARRSNEEAAAILGISLRTLYRKMKEYNINR